MEEQSLKWDDYFYNIAEAVKERSKDDCPVGAVIVHTEDSIILSTGYNGLPRNVLDLEERIQPKEEKLSWTCHAEANAIYNAARLGISTKGATIYVTKFPCVACTMAIVQAGIARIFCKDDEIWKNDPLDNGRRAARILLEAGVKVHAPHLNTVPSYAEADTQSNGKITK